MKAPGGTLLIKFCSKRLKQTDRKRSELWQKMLKISVILIPWLFNFSQDRNDNLVSPRIVYPIPSARYECTESSKGGCSNQAATWYFCRLVSALQHRPPKVTRCKICNISELGSGKAWTVRKDFHLLSEISRVPDVLQINQTLLTLDAEQLAWIQTPKKH